MLVSNLPIDRVSLPGRILAFALKGRIAVAIVVDPSVDDADASLMARSMVEQMDRLGTDKAWRLSVR